MLRFLFPLLLVGLILMVFIADLAEAPRAAERSQQQTALLVELDRVGTPDAQQLVMEWRAAYPQPTAENLTELHIIVERVQADPATAASFTVSAKRQSAARFRQLVNTPFSNGSRDHKPGL